MSVSRVVPHMEEWHCFSKYATHSPQLAALIHSNDAGLRFAVLHEFIPNPFHSSVVLKFAIK